MKRLLAYACLLGVAFVTVLNATGPHVESVRAAENTLQYQLVPKWAQIPGDGNWGTMSAVSIDTDGTIYVLQRTDPGGPDSAVMAFDPQGRFLRSWGKGEFPSAHGLRVGPNHTIWVTDRKLEQVIEYDNQGKELMTLGTKNVAGDNTSETAFNGVADVAFGKDGDIFIADGEGPNTRVVMFSRTGKLLKMWGTKGADVGQFDTPHNLAIDSRGRIWVCDRGNKRIEIFDQDGKFLEQTTQFGTPSAIAISKDGMVYVADYMPGNSIMIGTLDGKILGEIDGLKGAHGLAIDPDGSIYVAESSGKTVDKYVKK